MNTCCSKHVDINFKNCVFCWFTLPNYHNAWYKKHKLCKYYKWKEQFPKYGNLTEKGEESVDMWVSHH
jgi:hypothetical protein